MIKRRFYKIEHGNRDAPSESSSSSDSEVEAEATEESESEEEESEEGEEDGEEEEGNGNEDEVKVREKNQSCLSSSGYESEDSSANDVNIDSSGLPTSDDDTGTEHDRQIAMEGHLSGAGDAESVDIQHNIASKDGEVPSDLPDCAVKCKSVYKCRLCPRIVCLTEETLQAHLKSKRHARSEKLLKEGRLKLMLNDNGKIEEETPREKPASAEEDAPYSGNKKGKKRPRISRRWSKKKKGGHAKFARKDLSKERRVNGR